MSAPRSAEGAPERATMLWSPNEAKKKRAVSGSGFLGLNLFSRGKKTKPDTLNSWGSLFTVDLPTLPRAAASSEEAEASESTSSSWLQAEKELIERTTNTPVTVVDLGTGRPVAYFESLLRGADEAPSPAESEPPYLRFLSDSRTIPTLESLTRETGALLNHLKRGRSVLVLCDTPAHLAVVVSAVWLSHAAWVSERLPLDKIQEEAKRRHRLELQRAKRRKQAYERRHRSEAGSGHPVHNNRRGLALFWSRTPAEAPSRESESPVAAAFPLRRASPPPTPTWRVRWSEMLEQRRKRMSQHKMNRYEPSVVARVVSLVWRHRPEAPDLSTMLPALVPLSFRGRPERTTCALANIVLASAPRIATKAEPGLETGKGMRPLVLVVSGDGSILHSSASRGRNWTIDYREPHVDEPVYLPIGASMPLPREMTAPPHPPMCGADEVRIKVYHVLPPGSSGASRMEVFSVWFSVHDAVRSALQTLHAQPGSPPARPAATKPASWWSRTRREESSSSFSPSSPVSPLPATESVSSVEGASFLGTRTISLYFTLADIDRAKKVDHRFDADFGVRVDLVLTTTVEGRGLSTHQAAAETTTSPQLSAVTELSNSAAALPEPTPVTLSLRYAKCWVCGTQRELIPVSSRPKGRRRACRTCGAFAGHWTEWRDELTTRRPKGDVHDHDGSPRLETASLDLSPSMSLLSFGGSPRPRTAMPPGSTVSATSTTTTTTMDASNANHRAILAGYTLRLHEMFPWMEKDAIAERLSRTQRTGGDLDAASASYALELASQGHGSARSALPPIGTRVRTPYGVGKFMGVVTCDLGPVFSEIVEQAMMSRLQRFRENPSSPYRAPEMTLLHLASSIARTLQVQAGQPSSEIVRSLRVDLDWGGTANLNPNHPEALEALEEEPAEPPAAAAAARAGGAPETEEEFVFMDTSNDAYLAQMLQAEMNAEAQGASADHEFLNLSDDDTPRSNLWSQPRDPEAWPPRRVVSPLQRRVERLSALPLRKHPGTEKSAGRSDDESLSNSQTQRADEAAQRCLVCQYDYVVGEDIRTLPCIHSFHAACVDQWLADKDICPVCRHKAGL